MAGARKVMVFLAGLLVGPAAASEAAAQGQPAGTPPTTPAASPAPPADHPAPSVPPGVTGPVATLPGFEMQADGSSRLFVQLTQTVPVEERRGPRRITYVLKGAKVVKRNNQNALVTVHFNTPVTSARLRRAGGDLAFIVDLRANVVPTWKLAPAKDNSAILEIDFPKGEFIKGGTEEVVEEGPAPSEGGDAAEVEGTPSKPPPTVLHTTRRVRKNRGKAPPSNPPPGGVQ